MINCEKFYKNLTESGLNFFAGVPDSLLKSFCAYVTDHSVPEKNIITANEGGAIALAAGHYLATGKAGLVYMQNSGLGNAINPLTSLVDKEVYSIPMLLLIGWRAEPDVKDEPQHAKMGKVTLPMLKTLGIPYKILDDDFEKTIQEAKSYMEKNSAPFALVIKKDTFESYQLKNIKTEERGLLSREEAIKTTLPLLEDDSVVVATTGMTSRELFELREAKKQGHAKDFLTVGSMGHASKIALGIALAKPDKQIYCFDGDGAMIMHMGHLAIIGQAKLKNFRHIVFNNGAHDSVGGQPTVAQLINLSKIAKANGYKESFSAKTKKEIVEKIKQMKKVSGSVFLEIKVKKGARNNLGRPTSTPQENKRAFMDFFSNSSTERLKKILAKEKPEKIFLVTGKKSFELSGAKQIFEKVLSAYQVRQFSDFEANPNLKDLERGVKVFKKFKPDLVLAIGGGSVIDMAKLINIFSFQKGKPVEYIKKEKTIVQKGGLLIAVPTTAGTGSEVTHFAVIYLETPFPSREKTKYSVAHPHLLPDYSIVDTLFTMSLPPYITASTGMDALCQAIESFWSLNSTEVSREYSREAIKLVVDNIEEAVKTSSLKSKQAMMQAAHLAGKAINIAKTTAPHAISYTFTSHFGIPHGHAVGLTMPKVFEYNCKLNKNFRELYSLLGAKTALSVAKRLEKLMQEIGLETKLSRLGVKKSDLDLIVNSVNLERLKNNPVSIEKSELKEILRSIF